MLLPKGAMSLAPMKCRPSGIPNRVVYAVSQGLAEAENDLRRPPGWPVWRRGVRRDHLLSPSSGQPTASTVFAGRSAGPSREMEVMGRSLVILDDFLEEERLLPSVPALGDVMRMPEITTRVSRAMA